MKGLKTRIIVLFFTILFSFYLLIPSLIKFSTGKSVPKAPKADDPWYYSYIPSETLKLGLDLKGGLHLVMGIDFNEVNRDAVTKLKNQLKELAEREKIEGATYETTADNKVVVKYSSDETWKKIEKVIGTELSQLLDFDSQTKESASLHMTQLYEAEVRRRAIDQSMETLRNRIDEFGIAEPIIQRHGEEKILIQFPGIQEPGRLKEIIARTAKLSFQIERSGPDVPNETPSEQQLKDWVAAFEKEKQMKPEEGKPISIYLAELNKYLTGKIPANTEILFSKKTNINTHEVEYIPYLLDREPLVTGEDLADAYYSFDPQNNEPIVHFRMTPAGSQRFEKATGENVYKHMAIVLDNNVHSAPRIKQKISGGNAIIEMGGTGRSQQDIMNDAKDTSLVLRSGALPARLEFLEERIVGPSLGADAIKAGTYSLAAGLALVFLFMTVYYKGSGTFANIALLLNGLYIFAMMAAFEGTLTLPGLAGVTLTLGMAVDANVLIFERLREELRMGKAFGMALIEAYKRAFSAIIDSHVTTIMSGVVLLSFGYGPIRGFAVTLLIGLIASLYTSVFVTRVLFDSLVVSRNKTIGV